MRNDTEYAAGAGLPEPRNGNAHEGDLPPTDPELANAEEADREEADAELADAEKTDREDADAELVDAEETDAELTDTDEADREVSDADAELVDAEEADREDAAEEAGYGPAADETATDVADTPDEEPATAYDEVTETDADRERLVTDDEISAGDGELTDEPAAEADVEEEDDAEYDDALATEPVAGVTDEVPADEAEDAEPVEEARPVEATQPMDVPAEPEHQPVVDSFVDDARGADPYAIPEPALAPPPSFGVEPVAVGYAAVAEETEQGGADAALSDEEAVAAAEEPAGMMPGDADADLAPMAVTIAATDVERLRERWQHLQLRFIDNPRGTADQAQELVGEVVETLTTALRHQRDALDDWRDATGDDTEVFRAAVMRYRDFFDRLLSL